MGRILTEEKEHLIKELFDIYRERNSNRSCNFYGDRFDKLFELSEEKLKGILKIEKSR